MNGFSINIRYRTFTLNPFIYFPTEYKKSQGTHMPWLFLRQD
jgi:hypothetical protein